MGEQILSRSHSHLSITDDNVGLTESFFTLTKLYDVCTRIGSFIFGISFDFFIYYFLATLD
jgi:hypothetical protein